MIRLGVNIDHVATVRNARGGRHPDPVKAAEFLFQRTIGKVADQVTISTPRMLEILGPDGSGERHKLKAVE